MHMNFKQELEKTKSKTSEVPFNNNITTILFAMTAVIYFINAGYLYWYVKDTSNSEIITTISLGVMFLFIGFSFKYTPPQKE
jgi:hypothetical protein